MNQEQIINQIMTSKDEYTDKPTFLVHNVGGSWYKPEAMEDIRINGLKANHGNWDDVSRLVPHRPKGNFFWGEDKINPDDVAQIRVEISDLDTSKLWAFPSAASWLANELAKGVEGVEDLPEALKQIKPVLYEDYNCEFHAEWIYVDDVPAHLLKSVV